MPPTSIPSTRARGARGWPTGAFNALVGRQVESNSAIVLIILNAMALVVCGLALLFWLLGAAMAAGTTTPGLDLWLSRMLWTLAAAVGAFAWVIVALSFRRRWPWGIQLLAGAAVLVALLLYIFAPPGV